TGFVGARCHRSLTPDTSPSRPRGRQLSIFSTEERACIPHGPSSAQGPDAVASGQQVTGRSRARGVKSIEIAGTSDSREKVKAFGVPVTVCSNQGGFFGSEASEFADALEAAAGGRQETDAAIPSQLASR